jgi:hypothetical protein
MTRGGRHLHARDIGAPARPTAAECSLGAILALPRIRLAPTLRQAQGRPEQRRRATALPPAARLARLERARWSASADSGSRRCRAQPERARSESSALTSVITIRDLRISFGGTGRGRTKPGKPDSQRAGGRVANRSARSRAGSPPRVLCAVGCCRDAPWRRERLPRPSMACKIPRSPRAPRLVRCAQSAAEDPWPSSRSWLRLRSGAGIRCGRPGDRIGARSRR